MQSNIWQKLAATGFVVLIIVGNLRVASGFENQKESSPSAWIFFLSVGVILFSALMIVLQFFLSKTERKIDDSSSEI